jgi:hypothetical protein
LGLVPPEKDYEKDVSFLIWLLLSSMSESATNPFIGELLTSSSIKSWSFSKI